MTKLVLKTTAITLATVIVALLIAFGATALFAPKFIAGLCDDVGAYSASVFFYEKQYGKSESIDDLAMLVDKIDKERDSVLAKDYLKILIERDDFDSFCSEKDKTSPTDDVSTKEYYYGVYAVSLYRADDLDCAIETSKEFVEKEGYTKNNPLRALVSELDTDNSEDNKAVLEAIMSVASSINDIVQLQYIGQDVIIVSVS